MSLYQQHPLELKTCVAHLHRGHQSPCCCMGRAASESSPRAQRQQYRPRGAVCALGPCWGHKTGPASCTAGLAPSERSHGGNTASGQVQDGRQAGKQTGVHYVGQQQVGGSYACRYHGLFWPPWHAAAIHAANSASSRGLLLCNASSKMPVREPIHPVASTCNLCLRQLLDRLLTRQCI